MFTEQLKNEWPGLTSEAKKICEEWKIKDVTRVWHIEPKLKEWKKELKKAAHEQNEKCLRKKMGKLSKLEEYVESKEEYSKKSYIEKMNIFDARMFIRLRSKMFPCKENFPSDPINVADKWLCKACGVVDSQSHILNCAAYEELRQGKSLSSDKDMVEYYRKVLQIRSKLNIDQ